MVTTMEANTSTVVAISAESTDSTSQAVADARPQSTHVQPTTR